MNKLIRLSVAALLMAVCSMAQALTSTGNMSVTATVGGGGGGCTLVTHPLNFGTYTGTMLFVQSTIDVNCAQGLSFGVTALSMNSGGRVGMMLSGAASLQYDVGDPTTGVSIMGSPGTGGIVGTGSGSTIPLGIVGEILPNQGLITGNYQDTLIVTVSY